MGASATVEATSWGCGDPPRQPQQDGGASPLDRRQNDGHLQNDRAEPNDDNEHQDQIAVRTLVINAVGDTLAPHAAAKARAERIPGVRVLTLASGGHLLLGQHERVKAEIR